MSRDYIGRLFTVTYVLLVKYRCLETHISSAKGVDSIFPISLCSRTTIGFKYFLESCFRFTLHTLRSIKLRLRYNRFLLRL